MQAISTRTSVGWRLVDPSGFPDEAALHDLVEQAPEMLPLAGSPQLVILGREVRLGSGRADLLAVERDGRPVVIEIKLERNAEARRAVVAQVLAYAATLHGYDGASLARDVLGSHLAERDAASVVALAERTFQDPDFEPEDFATGLDHHLATGAFRLVIVLDSAPTELVELASYLEKMTQDRLQIDLVVVSAYTVAGTPVMVPQRVDPQRAEPEPQRTAPRRSSGRVPNSTLEPGAEQFFETARQLRPGDLRLIGKLEAWAATMHEEKLADFASYQGKWAVLVVRLQPEQSGMVAINLRESGLTAQLFRSTIERRAPDHLAALERLVGREIGQGTGVPAITDELLAALLDAYRAARVRV